MTNVLCLLIAPCLAISASAADTAAIEPARRVFATYGDVNLEAHVFTPQERAEARSAIVIA